MEKKKNIFGLIFFTLLLSFASCKKEKYFEGPDFYMDDFQSYNQLEDLLLPDDIFWSHTQITMDDNHITVDTLNGNKYLKFFALPSKGDDVSKCSISKQKMAFWEGETMRVSSKYYIVGTDKADWLFIQDLEEQTAVGAGPGIRLALVDNQLRIEHKFLQDDVVQVAGQEKDFPRNQWVDLVWEVKLSQKHKGYIKLWQDGDLIIDSDKEVTLPKDFLYAIQGTKGQYTSVEIGITANSPDNKITIYVDDFKVETVK